MPGAVECELLNQYIGCKTVDLWCICKRNRLRVCTRGGASSLAQRVQGTLFKIDDVEYLDPLIRAAFTDAAWLCKQLEPARQAISGDLQEEAFRSAAHRLGRNARQVFPFPKQTK